MVGNCVLVLTDNRWVALIVLAWGVSLGFFISIMIGKCSDGLLILRDYVMTNSFSSNAFRLW
jgi:hypothetical protein